MVITCLSFFLQIAYQYLCHLEEAKKWMERCLSEELPPTTELEESMRNGVILVNDHLVGITNCTAAVGKEQLRFLPLFIP